jgi:hypothetical protein
MIHRLPFAAGLWLAALPAFAGLPPAADPERPVPAFSPAPALADYRRFDETSLDWAAAHAQVAPPSATGQAASPVAGGAESSVERPAGAHPHHSHQ